MTQRPQFFGRTTSAALATQDAPGVLCIQLDDGREIHIPATDEQVSGFGVGKPVRMVVYPTTDENVATLRGAIE